MLIEEAKRSNSSSSKRTQARCKDSLASSKGKSQAQHCQKPARRNCWYTQADIGGFKSLSLWISVNCTVSPWVSQVWSRIRSSRIISHHKFRASNAVLQARTSCLRDQEHGALWELLQQYKQYSNLYSNMSPNICANTPKNSKGILHVTSLTQKWKPHSLLQPIRRPVSGWFRLQCRKEPISEICRLAYHATNCSMCDLATLSGLHHFLACSSFPFGSGSLPLVWRQHSGPCFTSCKAK